MTLNIIFIVVTPDGYKSMLQWVVIVNVGVAFAILFLSVFFLARKVKLYFEI